MFIAIIRFIFFLMFEKFFIRVIYCWVHAITLERKYASMNNIR